MPSEYQIHHIEIDVLDAALPAKAVSRRQTLGIRLDDSVPTGLCFNPEGFLASSNWTWVAGSYFTSDGTPEVGLLFEIVGEVSAFLTSRSTH